ncbi:MerR family transcriptional regulator [Aquincola sp. S2]|uniref:MerR family transcriptional regulator n=1 Tax=Pseudaquabacterium terrae TaxID=2732868 RepID=A0ABX2EEU0_9BURK|nr:MerR family transcriptional regulator [Aquabacterium terrae]NRF67124.1 MerR family transcriptional regulator [Aquabacterium terrae]
MPLADSASVALTTARLCAAADVTRGMLRLYESEGLLPPPRRGDNGYRHYPEESVARLQAIRLLKELGFTLREVALVLAAHDGGPLDAEALQAMARAQLSQIDARLARLGLLRGYLADAAAGRLERITDPECRFLIDFLAAGAPTARGARLQPETTA